MEAQKLEIAQSEEKTVYTTCKCNCGGSHQCVIKAHVRDGKVVSVEPDDRYNKNVGREDDAVSEKDLLKIKLQRRPCVMGLAFHKYISHPERILYPIKRVPGTDITAVHIRRGNQRRSDRASDCASIGNKYGIRSGYLGRIPARLHFV